MAIDEVEPNSELESSSSNISTISKTCSSRCSEWWECMAENLRIAWDWVCDFSMDAYDLCAETISNCCTCCSNSNQDHNNRDVRSKRSFKKTTTSTNKKTTTPTFVATTTNSSPPSQMTSTNTTTTYTSRITQDVKSPQSGGPGGYSTGVTSPTMSTTGIGSIVNPQSVQLDQATGTNNNMPRVDNVVYQPQKPLPEPPKIEFVETGSIFGDRKRPGVDMNMLQVENGRFRSPGQSRTITGPGGRVIRVSFVSGFPTIKSSESFNSQSSNNSNINKNNSDDKMVPGDNRKGGYTKKFRNHKSSTKSVASVEEKYRTLSRERSPSDKNEQE